MLCREFWGKVEGSAWNIRCDSYGCLQDGVERAFWRGILDILCSVRHESDLALASIEQAVPVVTLPFLMASSAASLPLVAASIVVP
ncbi:hypothetical protein KQX54_000573, partial [Cotesia glomerata]